MQLFFNPDINAGSVQIAFSREESKHIAKVLRKREGDILHITNGRGSLFTTKVLNANHNKCEVEIISTDQTDPPPYQLHLAVAPTKMNDRFEWFLEKATEIGVQEITPLICDHSERKKVKLERFNRVLQSAMKQSLHTHLPILNEATRFNEFIQHEVSGQKFIAHCEEGRPRRPLMDQIEGGEKITILIGPEGDFSPEEIETALQAEWQAVSLGDSRLRTETAGIVACHTVAMKHQLLK